MTSFQLTIPYMHILSILIANNIIVTSIYFAVVDVNILRPDREAIGIMRRVCSRRGRILDGNVMNSCIAAITITANGDIGIRSILHTEIAEQITTALPKTNHRAAGSRFACCFRCLYLIPPWGTLSIND